MVRFGSRGWRVPLTYGTAIAAAAASSAVLITILFLSLSKIEYSLPRFGFFAIREFHIAIRDVTHLRDMTSLAQAAPGSADSLEHLSAANDLVYIRFKRIDGTGTASEIPAYASIVPRVVDAVTRLDAMIAAGLPLDENSLKEMGLELEQLVERMNDEYYKYGDEINVDLYSTEKSLKRFNYQIAFALAVLSLLAIGTAVLLIGRWETIKKLEFLAWRDATTGLKNRAWMSANRDMMLDRARLGGKQLRLFLIDLDQFKSVNDTFGHHIGDLLLKAVAEILQSVERPDEVVAIRLGGDEFAIMAIGDRHAAADALGDRLREQLNRFAELEGHHVRMGASIGMACFPEHGSDISTLLRNADSALYVAKAEGRSGFVTFSPAILNQFDKQLGEEAGIKRALNCDEFFLVWQPQFELATGRMIGAEALVRWRDPASGAIRLPMSFIPIAERGDLILEVDKVVLSKACLQAARWMPVSADDFVCSVNLSGKSLQNDAYFAHLLLVLRQTGLPPSRLQLEITEGVFIQNSRNALNMLTEIRNIGVGLALDDFGSGYSSFGYLADFNLDRLKIDRSFLSGLEASKKKQNIVRGIIALANSLGLTVLAEGVENEAQLDFLIAERCHSAQGFFMSQPIEENLLTDHLAARQGRMKDTDKFRLGLSA
ncbi:MAG: bifunctional diguanylate cyclase/phosphodiesterase [Mesorhizobium sp.]|uniref:putative bifunctional diguanylate cyclase/phosphodiesterase n=1 Tax=unclassified Mesorhizobium TaxID=325217 RepID=UPI000FE4E558|nr:MULTISPECIES: bifunctional diguanylate cyclase/phosphodiesterase [unclassified Mesorhizobium]RWB31941.1 MAG: bifunctional diguanylate cyclase/phosphodiesterase [Mesorhizobium sp.]RWB81230.1 MAG: bifunctional diguanylate cyclase/phosphodiesterase [Mesorhizobium sp.]RWC21562.1 MAG: bifunctional diguanylate cyclase/phosphodiesterase [Mesorhizobium sp.]RWD06948.1 MAG: bifunctional diguanylate cyclase/phosphodiesterase [Mesorhizobium sp.]RWD43819.1 MAG: bifunctional diguanylate cyclase/phosphodi